MPNRSSLIRRLAELRGTYTGETDSSLLPAVGQGAQLLDTTDRTLVLETLSRGYETRMLGVDPISPLSTRIRRAILPDAPSLGQRELEAAVLAAAGRVVNYLHLRPPADLSRPAKVFRMIRPQQHELVLHVEPDALAPLLLELLPRVTGNGVLGVPGLRVKLHRRHIELLLVDREPIDTVLIANVSYRQWIAAMTFVESLAPGAKNSCWSGGSDAPLSQLERLALAQGHRTCGPAGLMSAVLRRMSLFRDAPWFRARGRDCANLTMEWPQGPSFSQVTAQLLNPICGLPGDMLRVLHPHEDVLIITDLTSRCCLRHANGSPPTLLLRRSVQPDHVADQQTHSEGLRDATGAWSEWETVRTAPNPTMPGNMKR